MFPMPGSRTRPKARGPFQVNGTLSSSTIQVTNNSSKSLIVTDGTGDSLVVGAQKSVVLDFTLGAANPGATIQYIPSSTGTGNVLSVRSTNARIQIDALGGAGNPQIVIADTNTFGVPVLGGGNQSGIGLVEQSRPGSGNPVNFNMINLGASSGTGAENSCALNIWGTSSGTGTQNIIIFFNGFGANTWNSTTYSAMTGGLRLGEIAGCGTLPDGHFTQTETASVNFYTEQTWTGTQNDGSYTAPSNIVLRQCSTTLSAETNTHIFDFNGNHLLGRGWAANGNNVGTQNSLIVSTGVIPAFSGNIEIWFRSSAQQGLVIQQSLDSGVSGHAVLFATSTGAQVGSISATSVVTTYATTSDLRLKRDISSISPSWAADIIDAIEVVNHRWVHGSTEGAPVVGMIAQDLHKVIPEAIIVGDNGTTESSNFRAWMRDDSKIVPYLVAALQQTRAEVADIKRLLTLSSN